MKRPIREDYAAVADYLKALNEYTAATWAKVAMLNKISLAISFAAIALAATAILLRA